MLFSRKSSLFRLVTPLLVLFGGALVGQPAAAQGDLLVAPTRIILDGRRGTQVILSNIGSEEATYRISLVLRRMTPEGALEEVDELEVLPEETAALEMIRYAPRRITLPPGQPQAVRIAARPGAELPDGEYRVHMSFNSIPKPRPVTQASTEATGVTINLIPIYGVTIPIIVRHGKVSAQAALSQPQIVQGTNGPELAFAISRQGDISTYGEIRAIKAGLKEPMYLARGLAVYHELSERQVKLKLSPEQVVALKGPVRFEYREMPDAGGGLIAAVDTVL